MFDQREAILKIAVGGEDDAQQIFDKGNEIGEILIGLKIMVGGQYQDYASEPLELEELERYGLASIDYKKMVVESLYLSYCTPSCIVVLPIL